jgi:hypothetical protein
MRLRWYYGEQLRWTTRMIVLTLEPGEAEKLAQGAPDLQARYGMPIDPAPHARPGSSEPACRAVVAARLNAPPLQEPLLRRLRVRFFLDGVIDDPELIAGAARDVGLDPAQLLEWCAQEQVEQALQGDIAAARSPLPAARALDHKLGGPREERRYTAPSYEIAAPDGRTSAVPGFNPAEVYETAIANLAPQLVRRPRPSSVEEVLAWAGEALATAEIAMITRFDAQELRAALGRVAHAQPAGADVYWTLASPP